MFIGHFAVAFAAKRAAPKTSLGVLFAACQLPDLIWPVFLLLGWERVRIEPGVTAFSPLAFEHYPWTHSLLATVGWAVAAAILYGLWSRSRVGATMVGLLVLSHWVLDWVMHRPDLPLYPGSSFVGLGLWNSVAATLAVELVLFAIGLVIYLASTRSRGWTGNLLLAALVIMLLVIYTGDLFGSPPTDERALAWFALAGWILPFWAYAVDRYRPTL
jgi:membrane-bound metal-dependent hydrolase YbcI (DUF457 family)